MLTKDQYRVLHNDVVRAAFPDTEISFHDFEIDCVDGSCNKIGVQWDFKALVGAEQFKVVLVVITDCHREAILLHDVPKVGRIRVLEFSDPLLIEKIRNARTSRS